MGDPTEAGSGDAGQRAKLEADGNATIHHDVRRSLEESDPLYGALFTALHVGVVVHDSQGRITASNAAAERILGLTAEQMIGVTARDPRWQALRADGAPAQPSDHPSVVCRRTGRPVRDVVMGVRRSDGALVWANVNAEPLFRHGEDSPYAVVISFADITEHRKARDELERINSELESIVERRTAALADSSRRLEETLASITEAYFSVDREWRFLEVNPIAQERVFGRPAGELIGKVMWEEFPILATTKLYRDQVAKLALDQPVHFETASRLFPGRWFEVHTYPRSDRIEFYTRDITERKVAEAQLRASLEEKEILLKELHHRVKNSIQIIASMLSLQVSGDLPEAAIDPLREALTRVRALGLIHEKLFRSGTLDHMAMQPYLHDLVAALVVSFAPEGCTVQVREQLDDVTIPLDTAIPIALIVNELVTNALRHAFAGRSEGEITLTLSAAQTPLLILTVEDDGIGLPAGADLGASPSLGLQLVALLTEQIEATIEVDRSANTRFTITFSQS